MNTPKIIPLFSVLAALSAGLLATTAPAAAKAAKAEKPVVLEVRVDVPPTWRPFLDDDIAEAMVARVRDTFRRHDMTGRIEDVSRFEDRAAQTARLDLNLREWRIGRTGNIECTFSAGFVTADGVEHNLGLFSATEFSWGNHTRWQLSRAFERAAEDALDRLWRKMDAAELTAALLDASSATVAKND